ncbi:hypothetical protein R6Q57_016129 [Mikania cordata]
MNENQMQSHGTDNQNHNTPILDDTGDIESAELVLFQVSECYVYLIPPRKTAASYRADEWDINKWAWEGTMKVVSKGEECIIRLEDKATGDNILTLHCLLVEETKYETLIPMGYANELNPIMTKPKISNTLPRARVCISNALYIYNNDNEGRGQNIAANKIVVGIDT